MNWMEILAGISLLFNAFLIALVWRALAHADHLLRQRDTAWEQYFAVLMGDQPYSSPEDAARLGRSFKQQPPPSH